MWKGEVRRISPRKKRETTPVEIIHFKDEETTRSQKPLMAQTHNCSAKLLRCHVCTTVKKDASKNEGKRESGRRERRMVSWNGSLYHYDSPSFNRYTRMRPLVCPFWFEEGIRYMSQEHQVALHR